MTGRGLTILEDVESGFLKGRRGSSPLRKILTTEEAHQRETAEEAANEKRRSAVLRDFAVVRESADNKRRRHEAALYRLWRYRDVDKEAIAAFVAQNVPGSPYGSVERLDGLFGDIFAERCAKAKRCAVKRFLPKGETRVCKLEGCDKLVTWDIANRRWRVFCSREHMAEYSKKHPFEWGDPKRMKASVRLLERLLRQIKRHDIVYQSDIREGLRDRSRHVRYLVAFGCVERKAAYHLGRKTYRLRYVKDLVGALPTGPKEVK